MAIKTSIAFSILENLMLKNRNFCSRDYDDSLSFLQNILPFEIHTYSNPYQYWEIPPRWDLIHGKIYSQDKIIYEVDHPLKIIGLSKPFQGEVSREELLNHLHYDHRFPEAIPYHFRQFYRPWERDWGFCVPKTFYDSLNEKTYFVDIQTQESKGSLKVAEFHLEGQNPNCFVFVAHLDHPGMANDDLAGVAVGVEFFKRLASKKQKFSYKLILLPEIIGSEFYLGQTLQNKEHVIGACFLEMLGSKTPLALQRSLKSQSKIEEAMREVFKQNNISYREGSFKSIICNDEAVWQSHKIEMCSLSRFPYPEYHCSLDNLSIIDPTAIEESIWILEKTVEKLENKTVVKKHFKGTPCVSSPHLNLYVDPGQRAFGTHASKNVLEKRLLMDLILTEKESFFLEDLKVQLSHSEIIEELLRWEQKGLLTLT